MNRTEIISAAKPILFNTEMVRAILDGKKTVTRRVIKLKYGNTHIEWHKDKYGRTLVELQNDVEGETYGVREDGTSFRKVLAMRELRQPYRAGDILYVRETWCIYNGCYIYKVYDRNKKILEDVGNVQISWRPSIHMPKEAARIFLRVKNVSAEPLQNIDDVGAKTEGAQAFWIGDVSNTYPGGYVEDFIKIWNSTVKKSDLDKYGWEANPWVWVIEFERIEDDGET